MSSSKPSFNEVIPPYYERIQKQIAEYEKELTDSKYLEIDLDAIRARLGEIKTHVTGAVEASRNQTSYQTWTKTAKSNNLAYLGFETSMFPKLKEQVTQWWEKQIAELNRKVGEAEAERERLAAERKRLEEEEAEQERLEAERKRLEEEEAEQERLEAERKRLEEEAQKVPEWVEPLQKRLEELQDLTKEIEGTNWREQIWNTKVTRAFSTLNDDTISWAQKVQDIVGEFNFLAGDSDQKKPEESTPGELLSWINRLWEQQQEQWAEKDRQMFRDILVEKCKWAKMLEVDMVQNYHRNELIKLLQIMITQIPKTWEELWSHYQEHLNFKTENRDFLRGGEEEQQKMFDGTPKDCSELFKTKYLDLLYGWVQKINGVDPEKLANPPTPEELKTFNQAIEEEKAIVADLDHEKLGELVDSWLLEVGEFNLEEAVKKSMKQCLEQAPPTSLEQEAMEPLIKSSKKCFESTEENLEKAFKKIIEWLPYNESIFGDDLKLPSFSDGSSWFSQTMILKDLWKDFEKCKINLTRPYWHYQLNQQLEEVKGKIQKLKTLHDDYSDLYYPTQNPEMKEAIKLLKINYSSPLPTQWDNLLTYLDPKTNISRFMYQLEWLPKLHQHKVDLSLSYTFPWKSHPHDIKLTQEELVQNGFKEDDEKVWLPESYAYFMRAMQHYADVLTDELDQLDSDLNKVNMLLKYLHLDTTSPFETTINIAKDTEGASLGGRTLTQYSVVDSDKANWRSNPTSRIRDYWNDLLQSFGRHSAIVPEEVIDPDARKAIPEKLEGVSKVYLASRLPSEAVCEPEPLKLRTAYPLVEPEDLFLYRCTHLPHDFLERSKDVDRIKFEVVDLGLEIEERWYSTPPIDFFQGRSNTDSQGFEVVPLSLPDP